MSNDKEKRARKRVRELRDYYTHLATYVIINLLLLVINLLSSPNHLWFYWVTIFWGVGVAFHTVSTFITHGRILGKDWEDRKVKQYMEEDKD